MTQGTRMPPSEGNPFISLDGAVDACAQRGPSLVFSATESSELSPGIRVPCADVLQGVVVKVVDGFLDSLAHHRYQRSAGS
jgi:hypothetical protein